MTEPADNIVREFVERRGLSIPFLSSCRTLHARLLAEPDPARHQQARQIERDLQAALEAGEAGARAIGMPFDDDLLEARKLLEEWKGKS